MIHTIKKISFLLVPSILLSVHIPIWAASYPRHMSADSRVKIVNYDPANVVILKGRYGYQTQIVFAPNEIVQNVSLGDSAAWQAVPVANFLFIKPTVASRTNMTVLTNLNSYTFQLDSRDSEVEPTYQLRFQYPAGGFDGYGKSNAIATFDPAKLNWKYSFTGVRALAPIELFDNGQFTYFKFKTDGMSHVPAIFIVNEKGRESLVNFHVQGDYVVVNAVAKQFTLRFGETVTSIYNDAAIGDWQRI